MPESSYVKLSNAISKVNLFNAVTIVECLISNGRYLKAIYFCRNYNVLNILALTERNNDIFGYVSTGNVIPIISVFKLKIGVNSGNVIVNVVITAITSVDSITGFSICRFNNSYVIVNVLRRNELLFNCSASGANVMLDTGCLAAGVNLSFPFAPCMLSGCIVAVFTVTADRTGISSISGLCACRSDNRGLVIMTVAGITKLFLFTNYADTFLCTGSCAITFAYCEPISPEMIGFTNVVYVSFAITSRAFFNCLSLA